MPKPLIKAKGEQIVARRSCSERALRGGSILATAPRHVNTVGETRLYKIQDLVNHDRV